MILYKNSFCILLLIAFAIPVFVTANHVAAQNLFEHRSPNQFDQYSSVSARHRGDVLLVVVNESTDVENLNEQRLEKSGTSSVAGDGTYGFGGQLGATTGTASLDNSSSAKRGFAGKGESKLEQQLIDRFSVVVVDVQANENLMIAGRRSILIDGDMRILRLTGIVRRVDVQANNSVPSHLIANMNIELEGKGPEKSFSRQGWLGKKFNRAWPF